MAAASRALRSHAWRLAALAAVSLLALQLYFLARVALMLALDPQSTTFQRSEAWRLLIDKHFIAWNQEWVDFDRISPHLARAVIASEDAGFAEHSGVEWDALEAAWERNLRAQAQADKRNEQIDKREAQIAARNAGQVLRPLPRAAPKVIGGSTITQQLAKNLFLSGERSLARKAQEFAVTFMLEAMLSKRRILEIYLNNVEWGEGVFGAQAAARHYARADAARLSPAMAARLAVMLPAPKRFERNPGSAYVAGRAGTILARMAAVQLPP
jgi:monofunctional biosynthetic peptidoglycan transglycosylase